jgi:uncharacterized membrane protein YidH (DUF202 family)
VDTDSAEEAAPAGAQAERTALAWQRTGIGLVLIGLLITRWSVTEAFPAWPGIVVAGLGGLAGLILVRRRYHRVLHTVSTGQTPLSRYLVPSTTALMVLIVLGVAAGYAVELTEP